MSAQNHIHPTTFSTAPKQTQAVVENWGIGEIQNGKKKTKSKWAGGTRCVCSGKGGRGMELGREGVKGWGHRLGRGNGKKAGGVWWW